jgi:hypothetical protein
MTRKIFAASLLIFVASLTQARDYYLSPFGKDDNHGSERFPWRTTARLNASGIRPGDAVYLQGGAVFSGGLMIHGVSSADSSLIITSYGKGRAVIDAGDSSGVTVRNFGNVIIRDLEVIGRERMANNGFGVQVVNDLPDAPRLSNVRIENVIAHGFKWAGIYVGGVPTNLPGFSAQPECRHGFKNVVIENCSAFDNVYYGIYVSAPWSQFAKLNDYGNADVTIRDCSAYDNPGDPTFTENHSGSGIMLDDCDGGLIEYCVACRNGALNAGQNGGPIGIWTHTSTRVIIQYCESFSNRTGGAADGGGFDFDGGVSHSVMQYCYSHDNDGAGILVWEWGGVRQLEQDTLRFCISENDGRKHGYGAVHIGTSWKPVRDIVVYNNTLLMSAAPSDHQRVAWVGGKTNEHIFFYNNLLLSQNGVPLVEIEPMQKNVKFIGNGYWAADDFLFKENGNTFSTLAAWRKATGEETINGKDAGVIAEPRFAKFGVNEIIGSPRWLHELKSYRLPTDSPFCGTGADLRELGITLPVMDFWGKTVVQRGIGAGGCAAENKH